jgi:hypothetical protein
VGWLEKLELRGDSENCVSVGDKNGSYADIAGMCGLD